jgi:hypothetical protein
VTLLLFEVKTAFVNVCDEGNSLSEINVDGFIGRYFLIILIRVYDRAVFNAGRTTRAFILQNIPGLFRQGYREVSRFSFYAINFSISQDLNIGVPADLDQFGCENSSGTFIGRKSFVKLGHMAANGRCLIDQVDFITRRSKIKGGLNAADPSTDHQHISKMIVFGVFIKVLNVFYSQ